MGRDLIQFKIKQETCFALFNLMNSRWLHAQAQTSVYLILGFMSILTLIEFRF